MHWKQRQCYMSFTPQLKKAKATEYALETLEKRPDCYLCYQYVQRDPINERVYACVGHVHKQEKTQEKHIQNWDQSFLPRDTR